MLIASREADEFRREANVTVLSLEWSYTVLGMFAARVLSSTFLQPFEL